MYVFPIHFNPPRIPFLYFTPLALKQAIGVNQFRAYFLKVCYAKRVLLM
jgi:hypothetical protein